MTRLTRWLRVDPLEELNLADEMPEKVTEMRGHASRIVGSQHVKSVLAPHGKQFAPWITNEGGSDNGPVTDSCEIATLSR